MIPETPDPLDGADLLTEVYEWLETYIEPLDEADLQIVALWIAHTHLVTELYTTPRVLVTSPTPESGKTTLLEHVHRLSYRAVMMSTVSSPALITRMLAEEPRTVLIDEADRSLSPDKEGVGEIIAVLNSGYKKGSTRPVLVPSKESGWVSKELPTFSPVMMAGNSPRLPDDTMTRTITVRLMKDREGRCEDSDWEFIEDDAKALALKIAAWADQVRTGISEIRPELPPEIRGRLKEVWRPLAKVAVAAGGDWPQRVAWLSCRHADQIAADRDDQVTNQQPHLILLEHLAQMFEGRRFLPTEAIVSRLIIDHPEMWGPSSSYGKELTEQRLGRLLSRNYGINSDRQPDGDRKRGYRHSTLATVWRRAGITPPSSGLPGSTDTSGSREGDRTPDDSRQ